jgi:Skp family chaperone for outer membrane proteins
MRRRAKSGLIVLIATVSPLAAMASESQVVDPPTVTEKAPAAVIIVMDRSWVLREAKAGKSMLAQAKALAQKVEVDFGPERRKLLAEEAQNQQGHDPFDPSTRHARRKDLLARRSALEKLVQEREAALDEGMAKARAQIETEMLVIVEQVMAERAANIVLDNGLGAVGIHLDVTSTVIARLNAKLPKVTVKVP